MVVHRQLVRTPHIRPSRRSAVPPRKSVDDLAAGVDGEALSDTLLSSFVGPQPLWPSKGRQLSEWADALEGTSPNEGEMPPHTVQPLVRHPVLDEVEGRARGACSPPSLSSPSLLREGARGEPCLKEGVL